MMHGANMKIKVTNFRCKNKLNGTQSADYTLLNAKKLIRQLITRTGTVLETSIYSFFNHLSRLVARTRFITKKNF